MSSRVALSMLIAACTLLAACASDIHLQGTDSQDAAENASILKPSPDSMGFYYHIATLTSIDGERTGYQVNTVRVIVPPGEHTVATLYNAKDKLFKARSASGEVRFVAEAGHTYRVAAKEDLRTITFWIEDTDSGERVSRTHEVPFQESCDADFC